MKKISVLHIVPWFPNPDNKIEAIFIAEHLKALNNHCNNKVLHINFGKRNSFEKDNFEGIEIDRITIKPLIDKWVIKERLATIKIINYLKAEKQHFDVVNFYITYPNAVSIHKIAVKFKTLKFCMMEQWSAYHTQFHLPKGNRGRSRIENIFKNNIPLFTVSKALGGDIQNFIGNSNKRFDVIPNCIDTTLFTYKEKIKRTDFVFCSINNWSVMKNPIVLINAFAKLKSKYQNVKLVLAGDGVLIPEMKQLVVELQIQNSVIIKGRVSKNEVVSQLQNANTYCQSSNYETFSAICIEALATGTPVLATNVGGMKDFINPTNGVLVDDLEVESWFKAMESNYLNYNKIDTFKIAEDCKSKFNSKAVGELYYSKLVQVYEK
jgi:glycosyltransferase involved in cell wall biosynthesis